MGTIVISTISQPVEKLVDDITLKDRAERMGFEPVFSCEPNALALSVSKVGSFSLNSTETGNGAKLRGEMRALFSVP